MTPPLAEQPARVAAIAQRAQRDATDWSMVGALRNGQFTQALKDREWLLAEVERLHAAEARMREAIDAVNAELAGMRGRAEWFGTAPGNDSAKHTMASIAAELDHWQRRIRAAAILAQTPDGEGK